VRIYVKIIESLCVPTTLRRVLRVNLLFTNNPDVQELMINIVSRPIETNNVYVNNTCTYNTHYERTLQQHTCGRVDDARTTDCTTGTHSLYISVHIIVIIIIISHRMSDVPDDYPTAQLGINNRLGDVR
jgi:hypothetical protein